MKKLHACGAYWLDIKLSTIVVSNIPTMAGNQLLLSTSRLQIADVMVHYRTTVRDFQIICIVFPSKSQCICHSCTTADEEIRNSECHGSLSGD